MGIGCLGMNGGYPVSLAGQVPTVAGPKCEVEWALAEAPIWGSRPVDRWSFNDLLPLISQLFLDPEDVSDRGEEPVVDCIVQPYAVGNLIGWMRPELLGRRRA